MSEEHPSNSKVQRDAEDEILHLLRKGCGSVDWSQGLPDELKSIKLDAYGVNKKGQPVLVEVYARVGTLKAGHKKKITTDLAKLLLAEKLLGKESKKVFAICDGAVAKGIETSWMGEFIRQFGIDVTQVGLPPDMRERIEAAQKGQAKGIVSKKR